MSSGFVTVAPTSRGTRTSRRRRNKTTKSPTASITSIPPQSSSLSSIKSDQQSPSNQLPSNHVQTASSPPLQSNQAQLENKNIKKNGIKSTASPQTAPTTTNTNSETPSNEAIQSQTKPSSIWDRRKQARTQNKPKNPTKPASIKTEKKPIVQSGKIVNKTASKSDRGGSGGLSSQSRGFRSRRVAHSYNANSVDMTRKLPQRQIQTEQESFPSLQQANTKKSKPKQIKEVTEIKGIKEPSRLSGSSGYKPKRTAVQYNPDSVDMTRKPPSDNIRSPPADIAPKAVGSGLSSRSKGFRVQRTVSEIVRPTVSNSSVPVSSVTFGRGARRYVPPQIRGLSDTDKTKIMGTKNITNKSTEKMNKDSVTLNTPPKRVERETKKETAAVIVTPKKRSIKRQNISPAKSTQSTHSTSSRSSSSSKKKAIAPLQISERTKKYLEIRTKKSIKDVFLIKRDNKNVHDVASIKTELTKKIAANDDSASNEYYYNKDDMLDFVQNADFNALNDTSVEVTHSKDERLKSTVEAYNPYINTSSITQVYTQDDDMIPTHAPGQHTEPFPGMLPNVPLITDQNEIAHNAEIAKGSKLRPMVDEFIPGQFIAPNPHLMNQFGANPITQFQANTILQFNTNAAVSNQQWLNNDPSVGFKPHNRYGRRTYNNNNHRRYNNSNKRYQRDNRNKYGEFQRRQKHLKEEQTKAFKSSSSVEEEKLDFSVLPLWPFGDDLLNTQISDVFDGNGKLLIDDIYLNFLCSRASDMVYEFLTFNEIIRRMIPILNHRLYLRLHETAPVFNTLSISDWNLELRNGPTKRRRKKEGSSTDEFVKYIGNGDVFCSSGLFAFKNPLGLKQFLLSYSKSLSDWLSVVDWNGLKEYLENASNLETVIITGANYEEGFDGDKFDSDKMEELIALFSCLVATKTFIVESAPFHIKSNFITNLSAIISDLRLFDNKIIWNSNFLNAIKSHFCHLDRLGFPANCISIPIMIECIEGSVNELIIKNTQSHSQQNKLQRQDLAMLFERFDKIEFNSSLIVDYPSIKNQTKIKTISILSDTHNFFIPLLLNIPCSVNHLIIKNSTNLIIDVSQKHKYNTANIHTLTLHSSDYKQIQMIINHNIFPNLINLNIITKYYKNNLNLKNKNININISKDQSQY